MTKQVQEDSAAGATLRPQNKSEMINSAILKMSGMSIEDLSHYLNDTLAQVGHEADGVKDASAANQASLNMKPSAASTAMKESVREDLSLVLGEGEELSEELKDSVSTLFEAAIETRLTVERTALEEEFNTRLDEAYTQMSEEMATKVDAYLDAVVESWLAENQVAVESALRNELMDDFIAGLQNLFAEHYMNVPEAKVDVVEELAAKIATLEEQVDSTMTENASLKAAALVEQKGKTINAVCEGLALTQADKLRALAENIEFTGDIEDFTKKVGVIKESLGATSTKSVDDAPTGILIEESDIDAANPVQNVVLDPTMRHYASAISRTRGLR